MIDESNHLAGANLIPAALQSDSEGRLSSECNFAGKDGMSRWREMRGQK
jgi:hypothetical protein